MIRSVKIRIEVGVMLKIISLGISTITAFFVIIPLVFIYQLLFKKNQSVKHKVLILLFVCFLTGIFIVTGVPSINEVVLDFSINLIPFLDLMNSPFQYILNLILFLPIGILPPLLWRQFQKPRNIILLGFLLSLFIEIAQLFNFRTTDIDDLIMNTLGAAVGYLITTLFLKRDIMIYEEDKHNWNEMYIICSITILVLFFINSYLSGFVWTILYR